MAISVLLSPEEQQRFAEFIRRGAYIRGRWVAQAIREKMAREEVAYDAA